MRLGTAKKTPKICIILITIIQFLQIRLVERSFLDKVYVNIRKALNLVSTFVLGVTIRRAVSNSVHREGVNPNSMEGVNDLIDHIDLAKIMSLTVFTKLTSLYLRPKCTATMS